jgi:NitT/TauT family transport system substrate-binding protein
MRGGFEMNKKRGKHGSPRQWIILAAAVGWYALTAACPTFAADNATVRIGVTNASSDVMFYIAENKGFFAEENLSPEYVRFKSGTDMVAPLAAGQLDVGGGGASAGLYNAAARGLELKIVADKGSMPPGYGYMLLLVRKDLIDSGKFKDYKDLRGLKVGDSSIGGSGDALLNAALFKGGLRFGDVNKVYMAFPQLSIAFKNRAIDAALLTEPNASDPVRAGDAVKFARGDEIYPNQALAVILYGPSLLKNRDLGQRFMNAYLRAVRVYNDALKDGRLAGKAGDYVVDMLVKTTTVKDLDILRNMVPQGSNPAGTVNATSLRDDYRFYKSQGLIPRDIDPDSIVDNSFAAAAVAKLGPYQRTEQ